jgi:hypothetical protein
MLFLMDMGVGASLLQEVFGSDFSIRSGKRPLL